MPSHSLSDEQRATAAVEAAQQVHATLARNDSVLDR